MKDMKTSVNRIVVGAGLYASAVLHTAHNFRTKAASIGRIRFEINLCGIYFRTSEYAWRCHAHLCRETNYLCLMFRRSVAMSQTYQHFYSLGVASQSTARLIISIGLISNLGFWMPMFALLVLRSGLHGYRLYAERHFASKYAKEIFWYSCLRIEHDDGANTVNIYGIECKHKRMSTEVNIRWKQIGI